MKFSLGEISWYVYRDGKVCKRHEGYGRTLLPFDSLPDKLKDRVSFDRLPLKHKIVRLLEDGDYTSRELAVELGTSRHDAGRGLWQLEKDGLVKKETDDSAPRCPYRYSLKETT